ncbi:MAG: hypothetical protein ACRDNF_20490, partial [Streptosporangiaceae bacterium]
GGTTTAALNSATPPAETSPRHGHVHDVKQQVKAHVDLGTVGKLETNQGGAWGWLADETGLPVAPALADLLQER